MTKLKVAVGAAIVAGIGTMLVLEHQSLARLREENQALQQQAEQLTREAKARRRPPSPVTPAGGSASRQQGQLKDLTRLRDQASALRQQTSELAGLREKNRQLRSATGEPDDPAEAEFKEESRMRMEHLKQWGLSFHLYAANHNDQFPTSFEQAASVENAESLLDFGTNNFEVVYRGAVTNVAKPGETIVFRERQARSSPSGKWVKVYGFADGHVEIQSQPAEADFEAWEGQRMVVPR